MDPDGPLAFLGQQDLLMLNRSESVCGWETAWESTQLHLEFRYYFIAAQHCRHVAVGDAVTKTKAVSSDKRGTSDRERFHLNKNA